MEFFIWTSHFSTVCLQTEYSLLNPSLETMLRQEAYYQYYYRNWGGSECKYLQFYFPIEKFGFVYDFATLSPWKFLAYAMSFAVTHGLRRFSAWYKKMLLAFRISPELIFILWVSCEIQPVQVRIIIKHIHIEGIGYECIGSDEPSYWKFQLDSCWKFYFTSLFLASENWVRHARRVNVY